MDVFSSADSVAPINRPGPENEAAEVTRRGSVEGSAPRSQADQQLADPPSDIRRAGRSDYPAILRLTHGPGWRNVQARELWTGNSLVYSDLVIRRAARFLARDSDSTIPKRRMRRHVEILGAFALERNAELSQAAQVMVLGNLPGPEIAERLATSPESLRLWELLFFDVRPVLQAVDFINAAIIWREQRLGNIELAIRMRYALYGGPSVTRHLWELEVPCPQTASPATRLDAALAKLSVKAETALEIALTSPLAAARVVVACTRLQMAQPKMDLAIAQRKFLEFNQAKHDEELISLSRELEAAQEELVELRQRALAAKTAEQRSVEPPKTSNQQSIRSSAA